MILVMCNACSLVAMQRAMPRLSQSGLEKLRRANGMLEKLADKAHRSYQVQQAVQHTELGGKVGQDNMQTIVVILKIPRGDKPTVLGSMAGLLREAAKDAKRRYEAARLLVQAKHNFKIVGDSEGEERAGIRLSKLEYDDVLHERQKATDTCAPTYRIEYTPYKLSRHTRYLPDCSTIDY